jgi:hypothetical protein
MAEKDYLRAYRVFSTGVIEESASNTTQSTPGPYPPNFPLLRSPDGMPGGAVTVSSNGDRDGIVWVSVAPREATYDITPGAFMAFDALTLKLLWFDPGTDVYIAKFIPPTVAGGKAFRPSFGVESMIRCKPLSPNCVPAACTSHSDDNPSCGALVIYGMKPLPH